MTRSKTSRIVFLGRSSSTPHASIVDDHLISEITSSSAGSGPRRSGPILPIAIILTGVAAGLGGMLLALLLHFVQHVSASARTPRWSLTAKFDGEFASGSQTYAGTRALRYTW